MVEITHRKCNKCGVEKPVGQMVPSKRYTGGYMPLCNDCRAKYWRDRRGGDPELRARHTETVLRSKRLTKHGLLDPDYERMVAEQGDKCALCGTSEKGRSERFRTWNIDHCHKTQRTRGLLCHKCNIAVGYYENLLETVGEDRLMRYLHPERYSEPYIDPEDKAYLAGREWPPDVVRLAHKPLVINRIG